MFKAFLRTVIVMMAVLLLISCGSNETLKPVVVDQFPTVDADIMQILTWNIEQFPKDGANTLNSLTSLITDMDVDIIAVQEITDTDQFMALGNMLNDYSTIYSYPYSPDAEYYNPVIGYIYNNKKVSINNSYKIFANENRMFPRTPFVLNATWRNKEVVIINNHLKASGDNYIDYNDYWDEEYRRKDALDALSNYIDSNLSDKNVIVVGDFNDQIQEPESTNVFTSFKNNADYEFADYGMTIDSDDYSFPGWPSHLDHIIINSNLFDIFSNENSSCYTVKLDNIISGYESTISDHRPVLIKLDFNLE